MRLAVLDTNVIVSAGLNEIGVPAKLVLDWVLRGQVGTVTCPFVLDEYDEVVHRRKFVPFGFPPSWLEPLIESSLRLPDPEPWPYAIPDPKDAPFLALAHASGAWLVTGNLKHFPERARRGVTVVSPAEYLAKLTGGALRD